MEWLEQRMYYVVDKKEIFLCKFWIDETGEVDIENLPTPQEIAILFKQMRLREIHVEFTGVIVED